MVVCVASCEILRKLYLDVKSKHHSHMTIHSMNYTVTTSENDDRHPVQRIVCLNKM